MKKMAQEKQIYDDRKDFEQFIMLEDMNNEEFEQLRQQIQTTIGTDNDAYIEFTLKAMIKEKLEIVGDLMQQLLAKQQKIIEVAHMTTQPEVFGKNY